MSRRHTPLPMFFPVLISAARKALSKALHDYVTRTWQASSGRHTGSNHFPFRNHKTPKVSTKHAMQAFYSGCCRLLWARTLLIHGVCFLLINSNVISHFWGQSLLQTKGSHTKQYLQGVVFLHMRTAAQLKKK